MMEEGKMGQAAFQGCFYHRPCRNSILFTPFETHHSVFPPLFCRSHFKTKDKHSFTLLFSGLTVQMHIIFGPILFSSPPCASFMSRDLAKLFLSQQNFQPFHLARRTRKTQAPRGSFRSCTADIIRPALASWQRWHRHVCPCVCGGRGGNTEQTRLHRTRLT